MRFFLWKLSPKKYNKKIKHIKKCENGNMLRMRWKTYLMERTPLEKKIISVAAFMVTLMFNLLLFKVRTLQGTLIQ